VSGEIAVRKLPAAQDAQLAVIPDVKVEQVVHTLAPAALVEPRAQMLGRTLPCGQ
jgi:hypothetical protein